MLTGFTLPLPSGIFFNEITCDNIIILSDYSGDVTILMEGNVQHHHAM